MNIDKFKQQHVEIMACIADLRKFSRADIRGNAADIAKRIVSMSSTIKLHLAVEDQVLYPALRKEKDSVLAVLGNKFQDEMQAIASAYIGFASRWNHAAKVSDSPEEFRADANKVLRIVHDRMQKENTVFYPAIEAL